MDESPPTFSPAPAPFSPAQLEAAKSKKVVAGVLGILLGCFGTHKFVLGYMRAGIIMLGVTIASWTLGSCFALLTCFLFGCFGLPFWAGFIVMAIIGLVEGINYLTKSDEEFCRMYIANRREWF